MKRLVLVGAVATLLLAGCATTSSPPVRSSAASSAEEIEATVTPTPTPSPDPNAPLDAEAAYAVCIAKVSADFAPANEFVYRAFAEATVVPRDDGLLFVRVDYTDTALPAERAEDATAFCYVTGSTAEPYFASYGTYLRSMIDDLDPYDPTPEGEV